jgi:hypothetical protein
MNTSKFLKWSRNLVWIIILTFIAIALKSILCQRSETPVLDSLIISDTNHSVSHNDRNERMRRLTEIILPQQSSNAQEILTRSNERMQTKLSFIALFAFLLIPFLSSKTSTMRLGILIVVLFLFVSFYFFDIHTADFGYRQGHYKNLIDNTVDTLAKINFNDSTWYNVDYSRIPKWDDSMHAHSMSRKICNFSRPDLSQISFYFSPCIVLLGLYLFLTLPVKGRIGKRNIRRLIRAAQARLVRKNASREA